MGVEKKPSFQNLLFLYIKIPLAKGAMGVLLPILEVQVHDHRCHLETLLSLMLLTLVD